MQYETKTHKIHTQIKINLRTVNWAKCVKTRSRDTVRTAHLSVLMTVHSFSRPINTTPSWTCWTISGLHGHVLQPHTKFQRNQKIRGWVICVNCGSTNFHRQLSAAVLGPLVLEDEWIKPCQIWWGRGPKIDE